MPGEREEGDAQFHLAADISARPRVTAVQLFQAGGVTNPLRHLHAACNCPCKTFCMLEAHRGEVA